MCPEGRVETSGVLTRDQLLAPTPGQPQANATCPFFVHKTSHSLSRACTPAKAIGLDTVVLSFQARTIK
jgi:hypothetical protein